MVVGLREEKKEQTRRALIEAALRLFDEQGYEQTTVARIAAAAGVSTKTFFNYFAAKDDVLFADTADQDAAVLELIADRGPDESVVDVLLRAVDHLMRAPWTVRPDEELNVLRVRLLTHEPTLLARSMQRGLTTGSRVADAVHAAFPHLDRVTTDAMVGALVGAVQLAAIRIIARGGTPEELRQGVERATRVALRGVGETASRPEPSGH